MQADKIKWNARYLSMEMTNHPSDLLIQYQNLLIPHSQALDIACGNGRNLKFLASKQIDATGIDISDKALELIPKNPHIHTICADLDNYSLPLNSYEIVLNFYFLNRDILSQISGAIKQGGLFFLETFITHPDYPTSIQADKILQPGELESCFLDFKILHHHQHPIKRNNGDLACIVLFVAQKC